MFNNKKIKWLCLIIICLIIQHHKRVIKFKSLGEINTWIYNNIKYKDDFKIVYEPYSKTKFKVITDFWQYPFETEALKTGDCEDMGILFLKKAKRILGLNVIMIWVIDKNWTYSHIVIVYNNVVYDPMNNKIYDFFYYTQDKYVYRLYTYNTIDEEIKRNRYVLKIY